MDANPDYFCELGGISSKLIFVTAIHDTAIFRAANNWFSQQQTQEYLGIEIEVEQLRVPCTYIQMYVEPVHSFILKYK